MNKERKIGRAVVRGRMGEWTVMVFDSEGKRWPEADHFADDYCDAADTVRRMIPNGRSLSLKEAKEISDA